HGFGGDSGRGDHTDVGTFVGGFDRFASGKIYGLQGAAQGRDRFEIAANADVLAVGDAAFDTSRIVVGAGECGETGGSAVADFVLIVEGADLFPGDFLVQSDGTGGDDVTEDFDA